MAERVTTNDAFSACYITRLPIDPGPRYESQAGPSLYLNLNLLLLQGFAQMSSGAILSIFCLFLSFPVLLSMRPSV